MRSSWITRWALNPRTNVLIKNTGGETERRRCEDRGRASSDTVTIQETLESTEAGIDKEQTLS